MSTARQGVHEAREELGGRLRAIRTAAGVDGRTLAKRLGWPPSKVSKIQLGRQAPTTDDITAWTAACGVPEGAAGLHLLLRDLDSRYAEWRRQLREGHAAVQRSWAETEAAAKTVRAFEPCWVPGLLQTADYAAARFREHARLNGSRPDTDAAVAARLARQEVLYSPGRKRWHILLTEAALLYGLAPAPVMRAQIDRLVSASTLPAVRLGIVPMRTRLPVSPVHGFWVFDDHQVIVEVVSAELRLALPEEVAQYRKVFDLLAQSALYDAEARQLLTTAAEAWI
ncbi:helix-turn-helix transcriptional regulator [Streptomyces sp. OfavH-34-F]|uniref:helix-turn-helix domain-containing protein n=1 Tax=Streptomyces sp. OfavH-34-F TaxID=2917760 RepID=UPI001EF354C2|nr:helix-turn-helix transcriptional regulator [Streptomyces sp. OfavH-34-F]MCG7524492.1 helix-turn-helix transcriptional regulator [Streptomyces sp. OfavH-34-F]